MGSFTATAEPKAACKVKETNNCEERKDCTMLGFRAVALLAVLATTQCSADSPLSQISNPQSAYLTEMMVQSSSLEPAKCSQNVLEARRTATVTQGVKPTVSLQAALLIFLGVGIFAVFIAQAFQMVRNCEIIINLARRRILNSCIQTMISRLASLSPVKEFASPPLPRLNCFSPRCENTFTATRTTWTRLSTQGARSP